MYKIATRRSLGRELADAMEKAMENITGLVPFQARKLANLLHDSKDFFAKIRK